MDEKKEKLDCSKCRYSCSKSYIGEYCENCLKFHCILCKESEKDPQCSDFEKDTSVSDYIKKNNLDEDYIWHLYSIKENVLEMELEEFKELSRLLRK